MLHDETAPVTRLGDSFAGEQFPQRIETAPATVAARSQRRRAIRRRQAIHNPDRRQPPISAVRILPQQMHRVGPARRCPNRSTTSSIRSCGWTSYGTDALRFALARAAGRGPRHRRPDRRGIRRRHPQLHHENLERNAVRALNGATVTGELPDPSTLSTVARWIPLAAWSRHINSAPFPKLRPWQRHPATNRATPRMITRITALVG